MNRPRRRRRPNSAGRALRRRSTRPKTGWRKWALPCSLAARGGLAVVPVCRGRARWCCTPSACSKRRAWGLQHWVFLDSPRPQYPACSENMHEHRLTAASARAGAGATWYRTGTIEGMANAWPWFLRPAAWPLAAACAHLAIQRDHRTRSLPPQDRHQGRALAMAKKDPNPGQAWRFGPGGAASVDRTSDGNKSRWLRSRGHAPLGLSGAWRNDRADSCGQSIETSALGATVPEHGEPWMREKLRAQRRTHQKSERAALVSLAF